MRITHGLLPTTAQNEDDSLLEEVEEWVDEVITGTEAVLGFAKETFTKPKLTVPFEMSPVLDPGEPGVSRLTVGNALELIVGPSEFRRSLLQRIQTAKHSISLNFYLLNLADKGLEKAITDAIARGVHVRITSDNRTSLKGFANPGELNPSLQRLVDAGAEVRMAEYKRMAVNHRKLVLIDNEDALVCGFNLTDNYLKEAAEYHDSGVWVRGPAVRDIAVVFNDSWQRAGGEALPLPNPAPLREGPFVTTGVQIVSHAPQADRNIEREIIQRIDASTSRVRIANPFPMSKAIEKALIRARKRHVEVEWLWGRQLTREEAVMSRRSIKKLLAAGVKVYEHPGIMHTKAFSFDGRYAIVGSSNVDGFSTWHNGEAVLQFTGRAFVKALDRRLFDVDISQSKPLKTPPAATTGSRIKDWLLRLVEPLINRA